MRIAIVSYRGGTGKSLIAINLAKALTFDTLLIEADFFAPSLAYMRSHQGKYWNDYLLGNCNSKEIIQMVENIKVVYTNPDDPHIFTHIQNKDLWRGHFSNRILDFFKTQKERSFILIDNQAGRYLSSLTHIFFSDFVICVLRPDKSDVIATAKYLETLKKDFYLVWNQVLPHSRLKKAISEWNEQFFVPQETYKGTLGLIPFDEETAIQRWVDRKLFIQDTRFTEAIKEIAQKLVMMAMEQDKIQ
ncbi:MAG: MinD/ParA family protein [Candidatus Hodarchaeota archaeon]